MTAFDVQRQTALGDQVAGALRRSIITGELAPGVLLVEGKLADEFQVSRGPIRDALKTLTSEGLVSASGRSAKVLGLTAEDIDELFTLREALEHLALESALVADPPGLVTGLRRALDHMQDAVEQQNPDAFTIADVEFHGVFYRHANHRRLADVWAQYQPTIEVLLLAANEQHRDLHVPMKAHQVLAELVDKQDAAGAQAELHTHLDNSRKRLRRPYPDAAAAVSA